MRICFTSDLHGDAGLYQQLDELLCAETPDLLILGGDLLPDGERDDPLGTQVAYLQHVLMPRITAWRAAAPPLAVACVLGNHESACAWDALQEHHDAGRIVLLNHRRLWQHAGLALLGYSSTLATPHWAKDFERLDLPGDPIPSFEGVAWDAGRRCVRAVDLAEYFGGRATIAEELAQAPAMPDPWVFVAHTPPYDSALDRLSNIRDPIGSRAVRRFIEERRPLVALHGHSHESPILTGRYAEQVGATLCINPGQGHTRLQAVLFDAERPTETLRHTVFGPP